MSPFVHFIVDGERAEAFWPLRDDNFGSKLAEFLDDPVGVKGLVAERGIEVDAGSVHRRSCLVRIPANEAHLRELRGAREALIKDRTAALNRGKQLTVALLKRRDTDRLKQVERQLAKIDAEISQGIEAEPALKARLDMLVSIPGISIITATTLLVDMPELGSLEQAQAACLAGLAPIARQSGSWTGRAFIRGGRSSVRRALFMPALVAARFNPDLRTKYQHLIAAGKTAKVALTAIMRVGSFVQDFGR